MKKIKYTFKKFNGELIEFSSQEEFLNLKDELNHQYYIDMAIDRINKQEELNNKIRNINKYIPALQEKFKQYEVGLVHTKLKEDLKNNNKFMIWIDKEYTIDHKYINYSEVIEYLNKSA